MTSRLLRCAPSLLALSLAAAVQAESPAWDPSEVSVTAGELVQALDALLADPGLDAQQSTAVQQREHAAAISTARELRSRVVDYRKRIDQRYSRDESRPFWDRVDALRGEIRLYARHSWLPPATRAKADRVNELFDRLARLYSDGVQG